MTLSTLRSTVLLGGSPPMALSGPAYMSTGKMIPAAQTAPYMNEPHALGDIGLRMHPRAPHEKIPLSTDVKV